MTLIYKFLIPDDPFLIDQNLQRRQMRDSLENLNEIGKCLSWNEGEQGYILTVDEKKSVT